MFETFAVLSTLSCIAIFVVMFQMDRAGRREEAADKDESGSQSR